MLSASDVWLIVCVLFCVYVLVGLMIVALDEATNKYYVMTGVAWVVIFMLFVRG